jgi:hypothetical protein
VGIDEVVRCGTCPQRTSSQTVFPSQHQNRYEEAKIAIEAAIPKAPRSKRAATPADFLAVGAMMLPEKAQYDYLANLPKGEDVNEALNKAMRIIETSYPDLARILPQPISHRPPELSIISVNYQLEVNTRDMACNSANHASWFIQKTTSVC